MRFAPKKETTPLESSVASVSAKTYQTLVATVIKRATLIAKAKKSGESFSVKLHRLEIPNGAQYDEVVPRLLMQVLNLDFALGAYYDWTFEFIKD